MRTLTSDLKRSEILRALGLEPRRTGAEALLPVLGIFGAGLLIGAGIALAFAPKRGAELREDIGRRVSDASERVMAGRRAGQRGRRDIGQGGVEASRVEVEGRGAGLSP